MNTENNSIPVKQSMDDLKRASATNNAKRLKYKIPMKRGTVNSYRVTSRKKKRAIKRGFKKEIPYTFMDDMSILLRG